jgi:hypothetical protein
MQLSPAITLPHKILVGTHHKTGTVWMKTIFKAIARCHSLSFFSGLQNALPANWDIFFEDHSCFRFDAIPLSFRGLHLIRDPRDQAVSACFYHQTSPELWLHVPRPQFRGQTYQQMINSFANPDDRLLFEMENNAYVAIRAMQQWHYGRHEFLELKYEQLVCDTELRLFRRIFMFLGFPETVVPGLLNIARNCSLFSGKVPPSPHICSGRPGEWRQHFKRQHRRRFLELFSNVLIELGYEDDDAWASESE